MIALPERFYDHTSVSRHSDGTWHLLLDDMPVRIADTDGLSHHNEALMLAVQDEWDAQKTHIDFENMALTRLVGSRAGLRDALRQDMHDDIHNISQSDTLFYLAEHGSILAEKQDKLWTPWRAWMQHHSAILLHTTHSISAVAQPGEWHDYVSTLTSTLDDDALLSMHQLSGIFTSFILAYATMEHACTVDEAFQLAWLEHDTQMQQWGDDDAIIDKRNILLASARAAMMLHDANDVRSVT